MIYKHIEAPWGYLDDPTIAQVEGFIADAAIIFTTYGTAYTRNEVIGVQIGKNGPLLIQVDGHDSWERIAGKYIEE